MKNPVLIVALMSCLPALAWAQGPELTEEHKVLQKDVGTWDVKMKIWPAGPDGPVVEGICQETNRSLGNGLWVISNFKGSFGGVAFYGHGTFGYNTHKKKYVGTWVDNTNSAMTRMEGTYDKKNQTLTMYSEGVDEQGQPIKTKNVSVYKDDDTRTFTMSRLAPDSKDKYVKMMELHYTRRK